ncbi:hypothetical protein AKJ16_DCAP02138 [Drosera capensis]
MVLAKLQGVLPNFDEEAAARLIFELQRPDDCSSGQGIRNKNSSASTYSPTDEVSPVVAIWVLKRCRRSVQSLLYGS